jgi:hypothetical protein
MAKTKSKIKTWKQFSRHVRPRGCRLLIRLDRFPNSILVTGCQRSGTTMLSRVITQSEGMTNYWFGKDDELDAALILSGEVDHPSMGRHCFQTTFLNECYREYFDHNCRYQIIWVLRNPFSVVYSLMYHWRRWTLNELFQGCGAELLDDAMAARYQRYGLIGVPKIIKACLSFNGKVSQLFELKKRIRENSMMIVDYDQLVTERQRSLKKIYNFIGLPYKKQYGVLIHQKSTAKKNLLSDKEQSIVKKICLPVFEEASKLSDL